MILKGTCGRALFEEVMRVTGGDVLPSDVAASVLRRWSFRYSQGTVTSRDQATDSQLRLPLKEEA
ncbi:hypothetical protein E1287_21175 [Actinomadura sp. KC06]|uniref:hypothetical protein n=1 Tax=Actinomadura sp. KC06 TaxID=2530369 RepID=UPI001042D5C4|nr:hypothetical protein [Actinomadura sp. KC06]TDD32917.1 hypothetical protein E1287_21175 [Actinomadura sp. KC06]